MKKITYLYLEATDEESEIVVTTTIEQYCQDNELESLLSRIEQIAYNGEITVEEIEDPETEPTEEEDTASMLIDHEYRLTMLELFSDVAIE